MTTRHTEVFLVRHGQTESNKLGLFHGVTDVPLNPIGLRQAERVASRIAQIDGLRSLHSSPLQRALHTAHAISRMTRLHPRLHPGLSEMNFGIAEGLTIEELASHFPEASRRFTDLSDQEASFPGGESRGEFHRRIRETLDLILTTHSGERLVVVAHGGVIASVVAQVLGEDPGDWRKYHVENCSITHLEIATHGPVAHIVNDVVHLEGVELEDVEEAAAR